MSWVPLGHDTAVEPFLQQLDRGSLAHAWLLSGPQGIGKALVAQSLALLSMTQQATQGSLAERLEQLNEDPLKRLNAQGANPDLHTLEREANERGVLRANISVEQVRELHGFLSLSRSLSTRKVVIVDAADELNREAANALLKQLEEPRPHTLLLLVSHVPHRLLPTIRSRCLSLPLQALDAASFELWAEGRGFGAEKDRLFVASGGRPGFAEQLVEGELLDWRSQAKAALAGLSGVGLSQLKTLIEPLSARDKAERQDWARQVWLDLLAERARAGARAGESQAQIWAEAHTHFSQTFADINALNLDASASLTRRLLDLQARARDKAG